MTVASSETTRSTHFKLGSLSFIICFFTIASKAMSGVKSPVLPHAEHKSGKMRHQKARRVEKTATKTERKENEIFFF